MLFTRELWVKPTQQWSLQLRTSWWGHLTYASHLFYLLLIHSTLNSINFLISLISWGAVTQSHPLKFPGGKSGELSSQAVCGTSCAGRALSPESWVALNGTKRLTNLSVLPEPTQNRYSAHTSTSLSFSYRISIFAKVNEPVIPPLP